MVPWVVMDRILGGKRGMLRSLPPGASPLAGPTAELNTWAAEGRKVLSWFSESGENLMSPGQGRG